MADPSRYQLKDILGRGGMGVIFRARDTLMNREVALKTILDVHDQSAKDLFYREWGIQASITHPNIAEIHDIGEMRFEGQNRPYFVMPLFRGATLADLLRRDSHSLTLERVVPILLQACRGLQAAHDRKLIHRDLKPSNVFVLEDDSVKLIDFGIAHAGGSAHTAVRGTLSYMAPELLDGKPATAASDIFAMGVLAYESLTGRRPFNGADDASIAAAIRSSTPVPPGEIDSRIPGDVSRVIFRALAKQPWQRYGSVREFAEYLTKAARREPIDLFDPAKIGPRVEKAMRAFERGDYSMATDIVAELEGEGNVDPAITSLRRQIEQAQRGVRIRQYLESARRLFDEQEYSLALRKVQEALELDENHPDSLALRNEIEKRRRARTAQEWSELARRHLDNNAFTQARSVLGNLLELKPDDTAALSLRAELERKEAEFGKLRGEKERLHREARGAWERGEVTSAMANLERWMDLDRSTPETDASSAASVRHLFVSVRSEHESLRNSYDQARALLEAGKFDEASSICNLYLSKYPNHALFQSVRFDIDERRRQALSAYIAETDRRAASEPDLDRRVAILEEAVRRYPEESHFQRSLEPARAKRDLVNSILARARMFEENGKFAEALEQWELLGPVHGSYPGLEYEKDRVRKRRETQARGDAKNAWIAQVERLLDRGEYDRACADAAKAAAEFPSDPEIEEIGRTAEIRRERGFLAAAMVEDAREQLENGDAAGAASTLRKALAEDERHPVARPLLARTLAEQARAVVDAGGPDAEAETLLAEAAELEPQHALVRSLRTILTDRQRERAVSETMAEARRLFNERNLAGSLEVCERGLAMFPNDARLAQLAANLRSALAEQSQKSRKKEEAATAPAAAAVAAAPAPAVVVAPPPPVVPVAKPKSAPRGTIAGIGAAAACLAMIGGGIHFLRNRTAPEPAAAPPPAAVEPVSTPTEQPKRATPAIAFVNEIDGAKITLNGSPVTAESVPSMAGPFQLDVAAADGSGSATFRVSDDGAVSIEKPPTSNGLRLLLVDRAAGKVVVHAPAGDELSLDGKPGAEAASGLDAHEIEIRRQGEEPRSLRLPPVANGSLQVFAMRRGKPDFGTIVVSSNTDDLKVQVDSYVIPFLVKNGTALPKIPPGQHKVIVKKDGYEPLEPLTVTVKRGEDAVVKVQLRRMEAEFSARGLPAGSQLFIDGSPRDVGADGSVQAKLAPGDHTFELRKGSAKSKPVTRTARGGEPLAIGAAELALIPATGTLTVDVTPAGASISIKRDGESAFRPVTPPAALTEGSYTVSASAPGYTPAEAHVTIAAGKSASASFKLAAIAQPKDTAPASTRSAPAAQPVSKADLPGWRDVNGWLRRRGGGFSGVGSVKPGAPVSFQASLPDGKRLQWSVTTDAKNYMLFKLERRKFVQIAAVNGKQRTVAETAVDADLKNGVAVRISIANGKMVHSIGGVSIETALPAEQAEGGSFGFLIPGGDEFAIRDFKGR